MFVCLKNIFATDSFDNIILQEFASLDEEAREVYRYVAAMESSGVRVHRQLVVRLLGVNPSSIPGLLERLTDIVREYTIDEREGVYGWKVRHLVIAGLISKYKFGDPEKIVQLFENVIDAIFPSYDIEVRTIRELCNVSTGLPRIGNKEVQNRLLRKMMSIVPGERVPRHRLIRNLIALGAFEKAETEIRIFEKDLGVDGPVSRYRVDWMVARAVRTPGILKEDRIRILEDARAVAKSSIEKFPMNKSILNAYADVGVHYFRLTGSYEVFDDAMRELRESEDRLGDPAISQMISRQARRIGPQGREEPETASDADEE
jgi:hypothetical protein